MVMDLSQGSREDLASCLPAGDVQFTGMATRWCGDCAHGYTGGGSEREEGMGPYRCSAFWFFHMGPKHWEESRCGREPGKLNVFPYIILCV